MSKSAAKMAAGIPGAQRTLEDNLLLFEDGIKDLDAILAVDPIDVDALEIELDCIRDQHRTCLQITGSFIDKLRNCSMDYEAKIQIQRRFDLIKCMSFVEHHSRKKINEAKAKLKSTSTTADTTRHSTLPNRELPKFGGNVREWLAFWGAFEAIHESKVLSDCDKLHYLLQHLTKDSDPYKLVSSYPATGANYQAAVSSLQERYGRKKLLIKVFMRDMVKLVTENCTGNSPTSFIDLVTLLDSQIRNLQMLGISLDSYGDLLYAVVEGCIPTPILEGYKRTPGCREELEELLQYLQKEVHRQMETTLAQSAFGAATQSTSVSTKRALPNKINNSNVKTAAGFTNLTGSKGKDSCVFCTFPGHTPTDCRSAVKFDRQKRRKLLEEANACFNCFQRGHGSKTCKAKMTCLICGKGHHALMCNSGGGSKPAPPQENNKTQKEPAPTVKNQPTPEKQENEDESSTSVKMSNLVQRPDVLLQTLTVVLHGPNGTRKVRGVYDSLSTVSHILEGIPEEMAIKPFGHERVRHQLFGGQMTRARKEEIFEIVVSGLHEKEPFKLQLSAVPRITGVIHRHPTGPYLDECHRRGIILTDSEAESDAVEVLIGADYGELLKMGGEAVKLESGPIAVHTKLGWIISGRLESPPPQTLRRIAMLHLQATVTEKELSNMWALEAIGINDPAETKTRKEVEASALQHFKQTVKQEVDGRYTVALPFIEGHPEILDNRSVAQSRLQNATRKIQQQGILLQYDAVFKSWLEDKLIEIPPSQSAAACFYLPHRAVIKEGSTTPIRPVFDASVKTRCGPSLNDCLEKGPNLLELIPAILTRFRLDKVGAVADIKKAFQQINVVQEHRDKMRFLWWEDVPTCSKVKEYRHNRVVFGVTSSPFLLGATLQHHINQYPCFEATKELLLSSLYVDNAVVSLPSLEAAHRFKAESSSILATGCFDLRGWEFGPVEEEKTISVLGLLWNLREDTLQLDVRKLIEEPPAPATKRTLYSVINTLYDPLGFAAPFLVIAKILLKKVCSSEKRGWDDPLSIEAAADLDKWKKQLPLLEEVRLPRYIHVSADTTRLMLLCCSDASKDCFATAVYLRVETVEGVRVNLIQAKTRISPKKGVTIPRLELLSCLIGARLTKTVLEDIKKNIPVRYFTDSSTALTWILKDDAWATFVHNRVKEIRALSPREAWSHIPGVLNPADLPSRGCSIQKLIAENWWGGADWMYQPEEDWPATTPTGNLVNEEEVIKEKKKTVVSSINLQQESSFALQECYLRCGTYGKILRVIAYQLRAVDIMKRAAKFYGVIKKEEYDRAEAALFRLIQSPVELELVGNLPTFRDEHGVLHLKSLLIHGEEEDAFTTPVLLPGRNPLVRLLIQHEHERNHHAGVQYTQSSIRERYWITNSRKNIRNVIHRCATCRRDLAARAQVPATALPPERINSTKVFSITGVDVTGPLNVETGKVWVVIFCCAVYRAVHLELLHSLSTEAFLEAFQKFVARRGRPSVVFSDNGTNFVGASKLLQKVKWAKVEEYAAVNRICWRFNPPSAAWWGGWWERLIGMMKQIMRRSIGSRKLRTHQLEVLLTEIEGVMNDRPLTYLSDDIEDLRPLTPSCFLRDVPIAVVPELGITSGNALRGAFKKVQKLKEELRRRFRTEYLGQLVNNPPKKQPTNITPGSVVLVEWENHKRVDWPMGVVLQTIPGKDGVARVARVKTAKGVVVRPFQRLFPMELRDVSEEIPTHVREAILGIPEVQH